MSITRKAVPLILASGLLTGCAGIQKTDWPTCAAVGGVTGAALGAIESSEWAGGGAVLGAGARLDLRLGDRRRLSQERRGRDRKPGVLAARA